MSTERDELGLDDDFNLTEQIDIDAAVDKKERAERIAAFVRARKLAYGRVFDTGSSTPDDRALVRKDLANFCRSKRSTFHVDARMAAMLDGRREVALRIDDHLELDVDELIFKLA